MPTIRHNQRLYESLAFEKDMCGSQATATIHRLELSLCVAMLALCFLYKFQVTHYLLHADCVADLATGTHTQPA